MNETHLFILNLKHPIAFNMQRFNFYRFFGQVSDKTFFLILVICQVLFIFQGIDFADEGFHLTFYQLFFVHPESTVMNMMYWLTGIIGGTFYYLFPASGIMGIRLLGIFVILLTSFIAYSSLKKHINATNLRISILIIVLFVNSNDLKILYYDNLSSLLAVLSAFALYKGLVNRKNYQIILSGAFISLCMFARIPGITLLAFTSAILYFGFLKSEKFYPIIKQCLYFIAGFVGTTLIVLLIMNGLGQLDYYFENLKIVFAWGGSADDSHNLKQLIKNFINTYSQSVFRILIVILLVVILDYIQKLLCETKFPKKLINSSIQILIVSAFIFFLITNKITYTKLLSLIAGITLLVSAIILASRRYSIETKLLVFIGLLILLFAPLGSAGGLFGHGRNTFWIVLPFTIDFISRISTIKNTIELTDSENKADLLRLNYDEKNVTSFKNYVIALCLTACIYFSYFYPYFDMSNRSHMFSGIDNKFTSGILTSNKRATAINELLVESSKYVMKNDFVLAYDCIPMFHFLTETRPYMPNSWPWLYLPETFELELTKAFNKIGKPRIIVLQKMSTLNNDWPDNKYTINIKTAPDLKRDSILEDFMAKNNYQKVWENLMFEIQISNRKLN